MTVALIIIGWLACGALVYVADRPFQLDVRWTFGKRVKFMVRSLLRAPLAILILALLASLASMTLYWQFMDHVWNRPVKW